MKEKRTFQMYFDDILTSIERILEYTQGLDFIGFKRDYKTVDAVIRNFEVIGEAVKNIPDSVKEHYPDVPWDEMYSLRNRISHAYFGIDYAIVWDIITNYLSENKTQIEKISKEV